MEESDRIKNMTDYKEMEKFAPLSVWNVMREEGIPFDKVKYLSIGLSLAQKEHAPSFVKRMSRFSVDGIKFDFKDRIFLVPQGIGAKYAIDELYYKDGGGKPNYAIVDVGQLTVDVVTVVGGKVKRENARGESNEGVIRIINELKEYIAEKTPDNEVLSVKEIQEALIEGKLYRYGEEIDLSEKISELKRDYSRYLGMNLLSRYKNVFRKFKEIYLVGGGAYYVDVNEMAAAVKSFPASAIKIPENPEYFNAIGNLYAAEEALRKREEAGS
jgi:hypothetical protein